MNDNYSPKNKHKFQSMLDIYNLDLLRSQIQLHIISSAESEYFVVPDGKEKYMDTIIKELNDIGWKTSLSYGNTGLFIYETTPPINCIDSRKL